MELMATRSCILPSPVPTVPRQNLKWHDVHGKGLGSSSQQCCQRKGVSKQNAALLEGKEVANKTRCLVIGISNIYLCSRCTVTLINNFQDQAGYVGHVRVLFGNSKKKKHSNIKGTI